jgi:hypothetical protein
VAAGYFELYLSSIYIELGLRSTFQVLRGHQAYTQA